MILGVTGGLGSGKSTVCRLLAAYLGAERIDTDQICRQQLQPGEIGYNEFIRDGGEKFLQPDGLFDRVQLRKAVFSDPGLKSTLENILHRIVQEKLRSLFLKNEKTRQFVVVEVPLLYEVGWQVAFHKCLVVYGTINSRLHRVIERDGMAEEEVMMVMAAQLPLEEKIKLADYTINNSGTFASTVSQIAWLTKILIEDNKSREIQLR